MGSDLWVALFRIFTLGLLSWENTYRIAFLGVLVLQGIATYEFARRYFGRTAGTLAAIFMVLDPGDLFQGGWIWTTYFGVWPIVLGSSFCTWAFAKIEDVFHSNARRHIITAGCLIAAALVAHQMSLILLALALPFMLLDYWTRAGRRPTLPWLRVAAAYLIGFGLSCFSVLPFLSRAMLTIDRGGRTVTIASLVQRLVDLKLFNGCWSLITVLGIIGIVRALRTGQRGGMFLASACAACFFFATDIPFGVLHVERILPSMVKLESSRMVQAAKTFWFPLAAYGLTSLLSMARVGQIRQAGIFRHARWVLPVIFLIPFVKPTSEWIYKTQVHKNYDPEFSAALLNDYAQVNEWAKIRRHETKENYRIAFNTPSLDTLQVLTPMLNGTPIYKIESTPSHHFIQVPCEFDPKLFESLMVKYVVSDSPLDGSLYTLEQTFGSLRVYRFNRFQKDPFTVIGRGNADLVTFLPELVEIRLSNTAPDTRLKLHVARYERWEAVQGRRILPISTAPAYEHEHPYLMEVPVRDGLLQFKYVSRPVDSISLSISWLTVLFIGLALGIPPRWVQGMRLSRWVCRHRMAIKCATGVCVLVLAVIFLLRWGTLKHMLPQESVFHRAGSGNLTLAGHSCEKLGALDFECDGSPLRAQIVTGFNAPHLCMSTNDQGVLTLDMDTNLGKSLLVSYDPSSTQGSIKVAVNGQDLGTVDAKMPDLDLRYAHFDTRWLTQGRKAKLHVELSGGPLRCFDVRIEP